VSEPGHQRAIRFPSTRWSLIFEAQRSLPDEGATEALEQLCKMYWRPALAYVRREGYPPAEAEDLIQDFFIAVTRGKLVNSAAPARGRFRSLLLKSLKNFLIDAKISVGRQKRGGAIAFISWEQFGSDVPASSSPGAAFDAQWAVTLAEEAIRRLREECESKGQRWVFEGLIPYLDAERAEISYRSISAQLSMAEKNVKRLLHEFRKRYRSLLSEEVEKTLEDPSDVEDEIRYLCEALASAAV
jgi:RNA polymerase sigma factor (sigma-70 family)